MTKKFRQNIQETLETVEEEILAGVRECEDEYRSLSINDDQEIGDRASRSTSLDELDSVMRFYEFRLARTRAAKKRLKTGRYGICLDCGAPIGERRLLARPDALFCITCASKRERLRRYRVAMAR